MDINVYKNSYRSGTYLERVGIIDDAGSVIWTRKYYEPGNFEIHIPNTENNREALADVQTEFTDVLVSISDAKDAGIVEYMRIDDGESEILLKGRFATAFLDRHIIKGTYFANNISCEQAIKDMTSFSPFLKRKVILPSQIATTGKKVTFQATYKNILKQAVKVAMYSSFGLEVLPDFEKKNFILRFYAGKNRTGEDTSTPKVIFSDEFENINSAVYEFDKSNERTYEYVGGQGEGAARTVVQTGSVTDEFLRKEVFYNASGESKDEKDTDAQYKSRLTQKGKTDLEEYKISESFDCNTGADVNFTYGIDYDLGDLVLVKKESWGMEKKLRITEITETYENGGHIIEPTFGTPMSETVTWEDD